jgi:TPR repeat protein
MNELNWYIGHPSLTKTSLHLFTKMALDGEILAQYSLGEAYEEGKITPQNPELAMFWYLKAAESGYVRAQHTLGRVYEEGKITPQNP